MSNTQIYQLHKTYNLLYHSNVDYGSNINAMQTPVRLHIEEQKTRNMLSDLENKIAKWTQVAQDRHYDEECPICYEGIRINNYIVPSCGHKICLGCYKSCILSKSPCANNCCLCKGTIL
jgi:hypothetical protein|uniref:RING-type domain-containing protein n=1 Tax=viral metagenome TaxID=1070528 RepID=A0A6C0IK13_9ZZZZ